jgi:hypothetical protein
MQSLRDGTSKTVELTSRSLGSGGVHCFTKQIDHEEGWLKDELKYRSNASHLAAAVAVKAS